MGILYNRLYTDLVNHNLCGVVLSYLDDYDYVKLCSIEERVHLLLYNYVLDPNIFPHKMDYYHLQYSTDNSLRVSCCVMN